MSSVLILLGIVLVAGTITVIHLGTTVMALRMVILDVRRRYWTDAAFDFIAFVLLISLALVIIGVAIK